MQVLAEIGIQYEGVSKSADAVQGMASDLVITRCDAAAEDCPVWLGTGMRLYRSFPNPSATNNLDGFRNVRDAITNHPQSADRRYT